ncbi:MAG: helix-turn-helix domain-containing protein [Myxococcota bacterium]
MPSPVPGRRARGAEKRNRLTDAAERCFAERGFRATTIAVLAEAASVPQGNVYYYFKSKDAIAAAVVGRWHRQHDDTRRSGLAYLHGYIASAFERPRGLSRHGDARRLLLADLERADSPIAAELRALFAKVRAHVEASVRVALDDPEREADVVRLSRWLIAAVAGAQAHIFETGDASLASTLRETIEDRLRARLR